MSNSEKILAFALVVRVLFLIAVPADELFQPRTLSAYNDEQAHFQHILHYRYHNSRPLQTNSVAEAYPQRIFNYEYYQSPLYYFLCGRILRIMPEYFANVHLFRFINCIIGIWTILIVGRCLKLLSSVYAAAAMVMLSLLGSMVRFNTTVTNDALLWLFSAYFAYYALLSLANPKWLNILSMIFALSAAVWTKLAAVTLLPAMIFAVYSAYSPKKPLFRLLLSLLWSIPVLLLTLPLFLENYADYGAIFPLSTGSGSPVGSWQNLSLFALFSLANYYTHTFFFPFDNYWMGFFQACIFLFLGVVVLVIIFCAVKRFIIEFTTEQFFKKKPMIFLLLTLLTGVGGTLLMSLRYHQGEARMAFTALPAICFVLIYGSEKALGPYRKYILRLLPLLLALPYILLII